VAQTDEVEVGEARAGLAEAQEGAATGIDQGAGRAVDPDQVRLYHPISMVPIGRRMVCARLRRLKYI
jgi:hypothetical protein